MAADGWRSFRVASAPDAQHDHATPQRRTTVLHTAHEVEMIRPRIALPWLNTGFVFHDDEQIVVVGTAFIARRQVCTALRAAGLEVDERRTWLSLQADRSRVAARRSNL
jgi:hypothetical protein